MIDQKDYDYGQRYNQTNYKQLDKQGKGVSLNHSFFGLQLTFCSPLKVTTVTGNADITIPPKTTDQTKPSTDFTTTKKTETTTAFETKTTGYQTTVPSNVTVIYFTTPADRRSKCLQMRSDVLDSGIVGAWVPTCDEKGRFTRRQCNSSGET